MKLIILDRDGVINEDSDAYIKSPQEWLPIPDSLEAIAQLNKAGYHVAIATNQSGIARGYYSLAILQQIHAKMERQLTAVGGHIDAIEYCPHIPDDACTCRKPQAEMLLKLIQQFKVSKDNVIFVGDTLTDLGAARNAGVDFVLLKTGKGERIIAKHDIKALNVSIFADLATFVTSLLIAKRTDERNATS